MATRLIGVDSDDPKLPAGVIGASVGTVAGTIASGPAVATAQAAAESAASLAATALVDAAAATSLSGIDPRKYGLSSSAAPAVNRAALNMAIDEACGAVYLWDGSAWVIDTPAPDPVTNFRLASYAVVVPAGVYQIDAPIVIRSVIGLRVLGTGYCELQATANMTAIFDINGLSNGQIDGFCLQGANLLVEVDTALHSYWAVAGSLRSSTMNIFSNIWIRNLNYVQGIWLGRTGDGAVQVDNHTLINCLINGLWVTPEASRYQYGVRVGNGASGNNLVHRGVGLSVARNRYNIYNDNSQFIGIGLDLGWGEVDIWTGISGYNRYSGIRSEHSQRLLQTGGPTSACPQVEVDNAVFSAVDIATDRQWFRIHAAGTHKMSNCRVNGAGASPPLIVVGGGGTVGHLLVDGFSAQGTGSPYAAADLFSLGSTGTVEMRGFMRVTSGGSVQHEQDVSLPSANAQTGTTYTLASRDGMTRLVTCSNASPITLTVPTNATVPFAIGVEIDVVQLGVGQVTVAGDTGVTVNATPGLKLSAQYGRAKLRKTATDTWLLSGDIAA